MSSLDLLAVLLLMQPRIPLAFFDVRAHCWQMANTITLQFFLINKYHILATCSRIGEEHIADNQLLRYIKILPRYSVD